MTITNTIRMLALAGTALGVTIAPPALAQTADVPSAHPNVDAFGVDLVTGQYIYARSEASVGNLAVSRLWSGNQWQSDIVGMLTKKSSNNIALTFGERAVTFTLSGGNWVSDQANGGTLVAAAGNMEFTYTAPEGTVYEYGNPDLPPGLGDTGYQLCSDSGQWNCFLVPLTRSAPNQANLTYAWEVNTNCVLIPKVEILRCTQKPRLDRVSDNQGNEIEYSYGTSGPYDRRIGAILRVADGGNVVTSAILGYAYPNSTTVEVTDPDNAVWTYTLDTSGRLKTIERPGSSSADTTVTYQSDDRVTQVVQNGVTKTYSWSTSGGNTVLTTGGDPGAETITSNPTTQQIISRVATNGTYGYTFDSYGRVTQLQMPEGNKTQTDYDGRGNVTQTRSVSKDGTSTIVTSKAGYSSSCTNSKTCNKPLWTEDALGNRTNYTYSGTHGGVTKMELPAASSGQARPTTIYEYVAIPGKEIDESGNVVSTGENIYKLSLERFCTTAATCSGSANERQIAYTYDDLARMISKTVKAGNGTLAITHEYTLDDKGRVIIIDRLNDGSTNDRQYLEYDDSDRVTARIGAYTGYSRPADKYVYLPDGRIQQIQQGWTSGTSSSGMTVLSTVEYRYDANHRLILERLFDGTTSGTVKAAKQHDYDDQGRKTCEAVRMNPSAINIASLPDCLTLTTSTVNRPDRINWIRYNTNGWVSFVYSGYGTVDQSRETMWYDANGNLRYVRDGENNKTQILVDGHNRLHRIYYPDKAQGADAQSTNDFEWWTYNDNFQPITFRDRAGNTATLAYDNRGNLTQRTLSGEPTRTMSYNLADQLTQATYGTDTSGFVYDTLGRVTSETGFHGTVTHTYDSRGRRSKTTYPQTGLYVNYDYFTNDRLQRIRENGAAPVWVCWRPSPMTIFSACPRSLMATASCRRSRTTISTS